MYVQMDTRGLKTAEMKFVTCITGYSLLENRRNENTLEGLKIYSVETKLAQYRQT